MLRKEARVLEKLERTGFTPRLIDFFLDKYNQINDRRLIPREWAFHLENRLREAYGLQGVPLVIDFVPRSGRRRRRSAEIQEQPI